MKTNAFQELCAPSLFATNLRASSNLRILLQHVDCGGETENDFCLTIYGCNISILLQRRYGLGKNNLSGIISKTQKAKSNMVKIVGSPKLKQKSPMIARKLHKKRISSSSSSHIKLGCHIVLGSYFVLLCPLFICTCASSHPLPCR